jgi:hypothetical protein
MVNLDLQLHANQLRIYDSPAKVKVVNCGRRFGKTVLAGNVVVTKAFTVPDSMSWIISPRYAQTMIMWRMINKIIPKQYITDSSKGDLWIELENGSMLYAKSADNPDSLVGEGLDLAVLDEAARIKADAWEVSIQPALMDRDGDALLLSTPKGKNWYYQEFLKGEPAMKDEYPEYESFKFSSYDNPFLKLSVIERMKKKLTGPNFRQEIMAEFIDDGGEVFQGLEKCMIAPGLVFSPIPGRAYVMGVDLAKYEDYTVITVIDTETRMVTYFRRLSHMEWGPQKKIIESVARKWNDATMLIDATGVGDPVVEDLQSTVENIRPYKFSGNTLKKQVIEGLQIAFENQSIYIPRDPTLLGELGSFSMERLPSGLFRYSAPSGFHDDCVISLALATYGLEKEYGCRVVGTMADPKEDEDEKQEPIQSLYRSARINRINPERLVNYDEDVAGITSYGED